MSKIITKSKFISFWHCPLAAYKAEREKGKVSAVAKQKMDNGTELGILAQRYFDDKPFIIDREKPFASQLAETKKAIARKESSICEATFSKDNCFCQVDILHLNDEGTYDLVEVKSSTRVKDYHRRDIAFQWHVLKAAGVELGRALLMHVNTAYIFEDELDLTELLITEDLTSECEEMEPLVIETIQKAREVLTSEVEPEVDISSTCEEDYECPFKAYCIAKLSAEKQKVFNTKGLTWKQKIGTAASGILPRGKEVLSMADDETIIDKEKLKAFLEGIEYPLYMIDFESVQEVVPQWRWQRPWQQLPFQYSIHIIEEWGRPVKHKSFLASGKDDPREALVESMKKHIGDKGTLMAYNDTFEKTIIKRLGDVLPEHFLWLDALPDRFIDLMIPFKNRWFYKGDMRGSYSIKGVLPSLFPDDENLDYHSLAIQNGVMAQQAYRKLKNLTGAELKRHRKEMLEYCQLDTYAMVKILDYLHSIVYDVPKIY